MGVENSFDLNINSEQFAWLCRKLNAAVRKDNATWSVDLLSGGFKFSDELPVDVDDTPDCLLPLISLMRRLWGYRASLVEGQVRPDLAPTWESTRSLAPQWAGFTPERCAFSMNRVVHEVRAKETQFGLDMEFLEKGAME